jgi:site-specific recombinase XerD
MDKDLVDIYLDEKRLSLSPKSIKSYVSVLRGFKEYLGKPIEQAERTDVIGYINYLATGREGKNKVPSRNTLATVQRYITSLYNYLFENEYTEKNVVKGIRPVKVDKKAPVYLTIDEMIELFKTAGVDKRDNLVVHMLYSTGVRVSELCGIKKGDIDFKNQTIKVFGKGAKEREVIIDTKTRDYIEWYTKDMQSEDLVVGRSTRTIEKDVKVLAARAGIKKHVTPHKLRHSFATHVLQGGGNVVALQKLLGHASLNTTQIYTHYSTSELKDMYAHSHPMANNSIPEKVATN